MIEGLVDADSIERVVRRHFNPNSFEREMRRIRIRADSLRMWHETHADSLRQHMDMLRERWEREMPERLRERARRLREQAEQLEERAKEMETPPAPEVPARRDTTVGGEASGRVFERSVDEGIREATRAVVRSFDHGQYRRWAKQATESVTTDVTLFE